MPNLIVIGHNGDARNIEGQSGLSVMEVLRAAGVDELLALCGGCLSCGTCHVIIDPAFADRLEPASADENDLLESFDHRAVTSRLSCQIRFTEDLAGLKVTVAPQV